jgi:hypothetical protein
MYLIRSNKKIFILDLIDIADRNNIVDIFFAFKMMGPPPIHFDRNF